MRVQFEANCRADVLETWVCIVPDGLEGLALREAVDECLRKGEASFVLQEVSNERDREIVDRSIEVVA
jgi:hypothetical protein